MNNYAGKELLLQKVLLVLDRRGVDVEGVLDEAISISFGENDDSKNDADDSLNILRGQMDWFNKTNQKI